MAAVVDIGTMITQREGVHGGRPILAGTGVTVRRIVIWHKLGLIPEEIVDRVGHLSLAQVHAALAYYYANRDAIDADLAEEEADYEQLMREHYANRQQQL